MRSFCFDAPRPWLAAALLLASALCSPVSHAATTVSAGYTHSCAVPDTQAPRCWGTLAAPPWLAGQDVVDIQAGRDFSCALLNSGAVACWGKNDHAQLGTAPGATPGQPVGGLPDSAAAQVAAQKVVQVAVGERHACARTQGGDVYCWGDAGSGQLGTGVAGAAGAPSSAVAVKVIGLSGAVQVAAGQASTCAVLQGGHVACVGSGSGLAGIGSDSGTTRTVPGIADATGVSVSAGHGCLVRSGGQVACWGSNANGELGTPASAPNPNFTALATIPVEVQGLGGPARAVVAGAGFSCALLQSGGVECWGKNSHGQLGRGYPLAASLAPAPVVGILKALSLSAGAEHICAVLDGGYVNCWGNGQDYRLSIASCDLSSAYYPGYTYTRGPMFNNAACLSTFPAATPHAVAMLGPNRDTERVLRWAGASLPELFPGTYSFSELFDNISNYWLSSYPQARYLAVNMHGTPKLVFMGPESGNAILDLGPLADWMRMASPIAPFVGRWVLTTRDPYYPPCTINVRYAADGSSSTGMVSATCFVAEGGRTKVELSGTIDSRGVVLAGNHPEHASFSIHGLLDKDGSGTGSWKSGWIGYPWTAVKR